MYVLVLGVSSLVMTTNDKILCSILNNVSSKLLFSFFLPDDLTCDIHTHHQMLLISFDVQNSIKVDKAQRHDIPRHQVQQVSSVISTF